MGAQVCSSALGPRLGTPSRTPISPVPLETEILSSISRVSGTFKTGFSFSRQLGSPRAPPASEKCKKHSNYDVFRQWGAKTSAIIRFSSHSTSSSARPLGSPFGHPPSGSHFTAPLWDPIWGPLLDPYFCSSFLRLSSTLFYNGFGTLFGRCSSWGVSRGGSLEGPGGALAGLLGINLEGLWGPNFAAPLWDPTWGPPRRPLFLLPPGDRGPLLYFSCFWHI